MTIEPIDAGLVGLLPCPFCGNDERYSNDPSKRYAANTFEVVGYAAECSECGAFGPDALTYAEAYAAWNIRQQRPDSSEAAVERVTILARYRVEEVDDWNKGWNAALEVIERDVALATTPVAIGETWRPDVRTAEWMRERCAKAAEKFYTKELAHRSPLLGEAIRALSPDEASKDGGGR